MTDIDTAELRRLADAATPEPWHAADEHGNVPAAEPAWCVSRMDAGGEWMYDVADTTGPAEQPDAKFIAAARTAVPALLDELDRLRTLVADRVARGVRQVATIAGLRAQVAQLAARDDRQASTIRRLEADLDAAARRNLALESKVRRRGTVIEDFRVEARDLRWRLNRMGTHRWPAGLAPTVTDTGTSILSRYELRFGDEFVTHTQYREVAAMWLRVLDVSILNDRGPQTHGEHAGGGR